MKRIVEVALVIVCCLGSSTVDAFCGFYVSGSNDELYNDATRVSLVRDGQQTILGMQNNYKGPPEDFAMVIPVPVVLQKANVKTLDDSLFEALDTLTAPRLVEYWERDPCYEPPERRLGVFYDLKDPGVEVRGESSGTNGGAVRVEAEFDVDEYDIVILSSSESTALEQWLTDNDYEIPKGAAPYFKPYVQRGQYFFVARVDMEKVHYENGEAVLSPLRFEYESDDFELPVRLGLINSQGAQELIVYILARKQRYEVANLPNVTVPTNLTVAQETQGQFPRFYGELFDHVLRENPQAVVTEYAWPLGSCDPCPRQPITLDQFRKLGGDVIHRRSNLTEKELWLREYRWRWASRWVVTRLHTRYGKHSLGEDLVFREAAPITGGVGMPRGEDGEMAFQGARASDTNRFQARYIIRHFWEGTPGCASPDYGHWGGFGARRPALSPGSNSMSFSSAPGNTPLADYVVDLEEIDGLDNPPNAYDEPAGNVLDSWGKLVTPPDSKRSKPADSPSGCANCQSSSSLGFVFVGWLGLFAFRRRR
jgi:hypothetical protein